MNRRPGLQLIDERPSTDPGYPPPPAKQVETRCAGSSELFQASQSLMPGGVNTPGRSFRHVGGVPVFIDRGQGVYLFDVDENRYIDFVSSWGAIILGHANAHVTAALDAALQNGTSFGLSSPGEVTLAAAIIERIASIEKVRLVNSGTEAVQSAVRLAREATGRLDLVKFEGCYHGHVDDLLVKTGGDRRKGHAGLPTATRPTTHVLPYNDIDALRDFFSLYGRTIAAVIVEPVAANMGVIPPAAGFLETLRNETTAHGALLLFDEVVTGFRLRPGGAQEQYGVPADITILGKTLGGGLPVGAYGGSANLMDLLAPSGEVYQGGTFCGNPLMTAAALATLSHLTSDVYTHIEQQSTALAEGLRFILAKKGITASVHRVGSMLSVFFGIGHVSNYQHAAAADRGMYARFFHHMLRGGVHLPPSGMEAWFVTAAHDDFVLRETLSRASAALG